MLEFIKGTVLAMEIACAASIGYHEGRSEGLFGMTLPIAVAFNRVLDPRFPGSFCEVKHQRFQFSFVHQLDSLDMHERESARLAFWIAHQMIHELPAEPLYSNVLFFHSGPRPRSWNFDLLQEEFTYGSHTFYSHR